tara:strand:- start:6031 stop:6927 length:897 start_codon:yes stop_codon:yes gene_type:complete
MTNILECGNVDFQTVEYSTGLKMNLIVKVNEKNEIILPQLLRKITKDKDPSKEQWVFICDRGKFDIANESNEFNENVYFKQLYTESDNEIYYKNISAQYFKDVQRVNVENKQKDKQNTALLQEIKTLHEQMDKLETGCVTTTATSYLENQSEIFKNKLEQMLEQQHQLSGNIDELKKQLEEKENQNKALDRKLQHMSLNSEHNQIEAHLSKEIEMLQLELQSKTMELKSDRDNFSHIESDLNSKLKDNTDSMAELKSTTSSDLVALKKQNAADVLEMYLLSNDKEKALIVHCKQLLLR